MKAILKVMAPVRGNNLAKLEMVFECEYSELLAELVGIPELLFQMEVALNEHIPHIRVHSDIQE